MELRPYQRELIEKIKISHSKRCVAVLGCGGGKSVIQAQIAKNATDKGNRVLFLVHRKELCQQIAGTFQTMGVNLDLCYIGMVQTVTRRLKKMPEPALILQDEAHHALANNYRRIYDYWSNAYLLGFTATPQRMNEGGLGDVFDTLIESVSTAWLIENNYLSSYRYYGVQLADASKLHTRHGDYCKEEVEALMNQSAIFGSAVENWEKYAAGKQTIVYCSSIATSQATAEAFQAAGIAAKHLDGTTPLGERWATVAEFRDGRVTVLCNVDLFGEGFDVPDCEAVVLLRPTKSLTLHVQQSMRSMRYKAGKTAIILDHVGNYLRHGLPDDDRTWTLASKKKKTKSEIKIKQCPVCYAVVPQSAKECPHCKYVFQVEERQERERVEGVLLEEIKRMPYEEYRKAKTWEQLELFRKAKKFKFAWSIHKAVELQIPLPGKYYYMAYRMGLRL